MPNSSLHKSMYSLMLMDGLVARIDELALEEGTNRSNLINQILAEYLAMTTPEMRIGSIFRQIEELMNDTAIVPFVTPNQLTMSLKSSLEYKYRPTIKYEVELYRSPRRSIGRLSVIFRTQSEHLCEAMNWFFRIFAALEGHYLAPYRERGLLPQPDYELTGSRFTRAFAAPADRDYSEKELGQAISDYIAMFDRLLKSCLNDLEQLGADAAADRLEQRYAESLRKGIGLL